jgi:predicted permease
VPRQPPRLARALAGLALPPAEREFLLGDLEEQFAARSGRDGPARARQWYWRQAFAAAWHRGAVRRRRRAPSTRRTGDSVMRQVANDIRFALRQLRRQPSFTLVAVVSMALAIGANGLVYGVVDNIVLNPFTFPDADRLVSIGSTFPRLGGDEGFIEQHSLAEIDDFRRARTLTQLAAFDMGNRAVSSPDGLLTERVFTGLLLDDPLPALGLPPALGRGFTAVELGPTREQVAILSHRLWRSLYNADPDIVGTAIRMNGEPYTVVGVMGDGPTLVGTDLWIPWGADPAAVPRNRRQFTLVARLAPGATMRDADAELAAIAARTAAQYGSQFEEYLGWRARAATWTEAITGQFAGPARILLAAGILVLLIACANLTALMLARLNARRREIALRYALGAGGWQVWRLLLGESLAIALVATACGLALARLGLAYTPSMMPVFIANLGPAPSIDLRVLVYCGVLALAAAVFTTLVPAWQSRRTAPQPSLRDGGTSTRARHRARSVLVVAELTLAVVLLFGAGLLLRSYARIQQIDRGFDPTNILTMRLTLAQETYDREGTQRFFLELTERLRALPDVSAAGAASQLPPTMPFTTQFRVEGAPVGTETLPTAGITTITPGLFRVWGVPMVHGRDIEPADREGAPLVVVVNEAFMRRYLDGRPTGRLQSGDRAFDVVGVVADVRNDTLLRPARPEIFAPYAQSGYNNQLFLAMRTRTEPMSVLPSVRKVIAEMDPNQPPYIIQTMDQAMASSLSPQRVSLALVGVFAVIAVLVAGIGVYGVVAFWVSARAREIGIRLALGATRRQVATLVVGQMARLVIAGAVLGLVAGMLAGRAAGSLLYETSAFDPVALAGVAALLAAVGLVASYLPSRRATSVDPVASLRVE